MAILDKVIVGINKGITTVGANSKAIVEKAKIKTTIAGLENERLDLVRLLGQKVYDGYVTGGEINIAELENFFVEIGLRVEELAKQEQALVMIENEVNRAVGAAAHSTLDGDSCACGLVNRHATYLSTLISIWPKVIPLCKNIYQDLSRLT